MSLKTHNQSQACQIQAIKATEAWLLSEQAGEDITQTKEGRAMLRDRVAYIITHGAGEWLDQQPTTEKI